MSRDAADTRDGVLYVYEAVITDTPARRATSLNVTLDDDDDGRDDGDGAGDDDGDEEGGGCEDAGTMTPA